jgi:hypothetical protein
MDDDVSHSRIKSAETLKTPGHGDRKLDRLVSRVIYDPGLVGVGDVAGSSES